MPVDTLTRQLARAALELSDKSLAPAVIDKALALLADTLIVSAAGRADLAGLALSAVFGSSHGRSRVWFGAPDERHGVMDTTFINTLNAGALDYDSLNGAVHADLVTLPAAWAMAEHCRCSPPEMLRAYITASEVVSRLSRCASKPSRGWSGTSIYGGIGAALASGLLLGLDELQLTHALGLAAVQAAGTQQANIEQTLAKRLQPAFAARNGVAAALLAQAGATAPSQALEGPFGLRALYQSGNDSSLLEGWGQQWQLLDTAIKGYPVCACSHAAVQALLELKAHYAFAPDEVTELVAWISPFMQRLVGAPFSLQGDLQVVAQFNLRYHLASTLLRGPLTLAHLRAQALSDPTIAALVPRIRLVIDNGNLAELAPATLELRLSDGRRLRGTCRHMPGSPAAPWAASQWQAKARECAQAAGHDDIEGLLSRLATLPEQASLESIWSAT